MEAQARSWVFFYGLLVLPLLLPNIAFGGTERSLSMVFYMHDAVTGPNPTVVPMTAPMGNFSQLFKFGTSMAIDDVLTSGPSPGSPVVGRGQGFYTFDNARVGTVIDLLLMFTAVMHSPPHYNGSTLCFMGLDRTNLPQREIAIVGGTGAFRFARGFAILETSNINLQDAIIKFNVTLRL